MRTTLGLAALACVAVLLRLAVVQELADLPSMQVLVEDAAAYDATARLLVERGGVPETAFYQDPLYPYFLAAVYAVAGPSYEAVRWLQAFMGGATAVLAALAAARLGGGRPGAAFAGLAAALYAPLLFYVPLLQKETLLVLLVSGFVLATLVALDNRSWGWAAGAGALLGLAALLRGNLLLVAPIAAAALAVEAALGAPRARIPPWAPSLALLLGFACALAPVALLNHHASGDWILTSAQGGANFYLGNRRGASGLYQPLAAGRQTPAHEREDARRLAAAVVERERGTPVLPQTLSPGEVSRALWREGLREIARAPGAWLGGLGRKLLYAWNRAEVPDAEAYDAYRMESRWLAATPVGFALVAPLGLAGLVVVRRRTGARFLAIMVAATTLSVALFFVFARYRLVLVPFLLPAAGAGFAEVVARCRAGQWRPAAAWVAVAALATVLVAWPVFGAADRASWLALTQANLATAANRLGAEAAGSGDVERALTWLDEAERRARAALAADRRHLPARLALVVAALRRGNLRRALGETDRAAVEYDLAQLELTALLERPEVADYPEMADDARRRLGRAIAAGRAALGRRTAGEARPDPVEPSPTEGVPAPAGRRAPRAPRAPPAARGPLR
jgi:4-amino-4-deoxy-L-arabinose transferase-like glycosyltransferase